jgi:Na+-driven multidrug efflux pump
MARAVELVLVMLTAVAIVLVWRPGIWLDLFTTDPEIRAVGGSYLRTVGPSYPLLGISMVCSFTFQGLGRAMFPLIVVSSRTLIVVAGASLAAWMGSPVRTIFLIMAAGNATSSLLLWWRLRAMLGSTGAPPSPEIS